MKRQAILTRGITLALVGILTSAAIAFAGVSSPTVQQNPTIKTYQKQMQTPLKQKTQFQVVPPKPLHTGAVLTFTPNQVTFPRIKVFQGKFCAISSNGTCSAVNQKLVWRKVELAITQRNYTKVKVELMGTASGRADLNLRNTQKGSVYRYTFPRPVPFLNGISVQPWCDSITGNGTNAPKTAYYQPAAYMKLTISDQNGQGFYDEINIDFPISLTCVY